MAHHLALTVAELRVASRTGLTVQAAYDPEWYATGVKISADYATIPHHPHQWHGEWNYTITPAA